MDIVTGHGVTKSIPCAQLNLLNLLKQTYSTLRPILINEKFQDAINKCVNISLEDNDKDLEDLVSQCKKYSFIGNSRITHA